MNVSSFYGSGSFYRVYKVSSKKSCSRKDLSLHEKIALLDEMKKQPEGTSLRKLEKILKVLQSTISHLRATEKQIWEEWSCTEAENRKRKREGKDPQVDEGSKPMVLKNYRMWCAPLRPYAERKSRGTHSENVSLKTTAFYVQWNSLIWDKNSSARCVPNKQSRLYKKMLENRTWCSWGWNSKQSSRKISPKWRDNSNSILIDSLIPRDLGESNTGTIFNHYHILNICSEINIFA